MIDLKDKLEEKASGILTTLMRDRREHYVENVSKSSLDKVKAEYKVKQSSYISSFSSRLALYHSIVQDRVLPWVKWTHPWGHGSTKPIHFGRFHLLRQKCCSKNRLSGVGDGPLTQSFQKSVTSPLTHFLWSL